MGTQPTEPLLRRFEAAASEGPKLYHATRVVLSTSPTLSADGGPPPRWWSGVDAGTGWEPFLSAERVFEAREYERRSRWHQSCYHGDAGRVNEYTLLAAEACGLLPPRYAIPSGDLHRGIHHLNRDVWTFFLYRLAVRDRAAVGLDIHGLPPYADFAFPGLEAIVACTTEDTEREERMLTRFRDGYYRGSGRVPEFVFAGLRVDVFAASVLALRHLAAYKGDLYGSPDAIEAAVSGDRTEPARPNGSRQDSDENEGGRTTKRARGQNEERDAWIYQQCLDGVPYAKIVAELQERSEECGWEVLESPQAAQQAGVRHAKRHNLKRPPRRKDGG